MNRQHCPFSANESHEKQRDSCLKRDNEIQSCMGWGGGGEILKQDNEIQSCMGWGGGAENFQMRISLFLTRLVCPKRTVLSVTPEVYCKVLYFFYYIAAFRTLYCIILLDVFSNFNYVIVTIVRWSLRCQITNLWGLVY